MPSRYSVLLQEDPTRRSRYADLLEPETPETLFEPSKPFEIEPTPSVPVDGMPVTTGVVSDHVLFERSKPLMIEPVKAAPSTVQPLSLSLSKPISIQPTEFPPSTTSSVGLFDPIIAEAARNTGLPVTLIQAIISKESGGDPTAVSNRGAIGLMQVMPDTGKSIKPGDLFDPKHNIEVGTKYLKYLLDRFGDLETALAAYNTGPTSVAEGRIDSEARNYAREVLRLRQSLDHGMRLSGVSSISVPSRPTGQASVEAPAPGGTPRSWEPEPNYNVKRTPPAAPASEPPGFVSRYAEAMRREGIPGQHPSAVTRGFITGLFQGNPQTVGETAEALGYLTGSEYLKGVGKSWQATAVDPRFQPSGTTMEEAAGSVEKALTWAGENFGQGLASTVPSVALGVAGGIAGSPAGPGGIAAGAAAGAALPSFALNYGDLYRALKDEGMAPEQAAKVALAPGAVISSLDVLGLGEIASVFTSAARKQVMHGLARRVIAAAAKGAGFEGTTEAYQQLIQESVLEEQNPGKVPLGKRMENVAQAGIVGAMVGAAGAAPAGIQGRPAAPAVPVTDQTEAKPFREETPPGAPPKPGQTVSVPPEAQPAPDVEILSVDQRKALVKRIQDAGEMPTTWIQANFGKRTLSDLTQADLVHAEAVLDALAAPAREAPETAPAQPNAPGVVPTPAPAAPEPAEEPSTQAATVAYRENPQKRSVELEFSKDPGDAIKNELRRDKWVFTKALKVWHREDTPEARAAGRAVADRFAPAVEEVPVAAVPATTGPAVVPEPALAGREAAPEPVQPVKRRAFGALVAPAAASVPVAPESAVPAVPATSAPALAPGQVATAPTPGTHEETGMNAEHPLAPEAPAPVRPVKTPEEIRAIMFPKSKVGQPQTLGEMMDAVPQLASYVAVVPTGEDLPAPIKEDAVARGHRIEGIEGAYYNGRVYLVQAKLTTPGAARGVVAHEVAIHHGLEIALGKEGYAGLAKEVFDNLSEPEQQDILRRAKIRSEELQAKGGASLAGNEWLGYEARRVIESGKTNPLWQRIAARIRPVLRKAGFRVKYNDVEIARLVEKGWNAAVTNPTTPVEVDETFWNDEDEAVEEAPAPEPIPTPEGKAPIVPAESLGRTVSLTVNGELRTAQLTPEQAKAWDAEEDDYQKTLTFIDRNYSDDRQQQEKERKGAGMRHAAVQRGIAGFLTKKEQAAAEAQANKLVPGRMVTVDLGDGTTATGKVVQQPVFGRIKVETQDRGTITVPVANAKVIREPSRGGKGLEGTPLAGAVEDEKRAAAAGEQTSLFADNATLTPPTLFSIATFHGTPHTMEPEEGAPLGRFRKEKVGTGEGAAAYGWGVAYLGGKKETAEFYRDYLSKSKPSPPTNRLFNYQGNTYVASLGDGVYLEAPIGELELSAKPISKEKYQVALKKAWEEYDRDSQGRGSLYHVEVLAELEEFLDWDLPLSEQSEGVRKALEDALPSRELSLANQSDSMGAWYTRTSRGFTPWMLKELGRLSEEKKVTKTGSGKQLVSEYLASLGIKGIRYLDQGSRNYRILSPSESVSKKWVVGEPQANRSDQHFFDTEEEARDFFKTVQTYNYVVFNESDLRITGRNGEMLTPTEAMDQQQTEPGTAGTRFSAASEAGASTPEEIGRKAVTGDEAVAKLKAHVVNPRSLKRRWEGLKAAWPDAPMWLRSGWIDTGAPLDMMAKVAEHFTGIPLTPSENPYEVLTFRRMSAAGLARLWAKDGMTDLARNRVGPALDEIAPLVAGKRSDFTAYLLARRTLALLNDPQGARETGISKEEAQAAKDQLETQNFKDAAKIWDDWHDGLKRYLSEASPSLAKMVEAWDARDPGSYMPLAREMDLEGLSVGQGKGGSPFQRLKGSVRKVKDPIATAISNAEKMISAAHKRQVLDAAVNLANLGGMEGLIEKVPRKNLPAATVGIADLLDRLGKKGVEIDTEAIPDELLADTITFFVPAKFPDKGELILPHVGADGKTSWYKVDKFIWRALASVDPVQLPKVVNLVAGGWARTFRAGTTGLRASFGLLINPIRDFFTMGFNSQFVRRPDQLMIGFTKSMRDAWLGRLGGEREWFDMFVRLGVDMSTSLGQDTRQTQRAAREVFEGRTVRIVDPRNWVEMYRDVLSTPEAVPRLTEMRLTAEKQGIDITKSLSMDDAIRLGNAGKRITTDFTAAGHYGRVANQVIPFFNAAVQGPRVTMRRIHQDPAGTIGGLLAYVTIPTLALWWWTKDDDWRKRMDWRSQMLNWHVPIPGSKELMRFPRPFEGGLFFAALPEMLLDSWYRQDPEGLKQWFPTMLSSTMPGTPLDIPPVKFALEQAANRDFFWNRPLVPKSMENMPAREQFNEYTSRAAITMGRTFNVSPMRVDHFIRSLFGGVGADLTVGLVGAGPEGKGTIAQEVEGYLAGNNDKADDLSNLPLFGRLFVRGGQQIAHSRQIEEVYQAYEQAVSRSLSKENPETPAERQRRLTLMDATKGLSALLAVRAQTQGEDKRRALSDEIVAIASEVMTAESGRGDFLVNTWTATIRRAAVDQEKGKLESDTLRREMAKARALTIKLPKGDPNQLIAVTAIRSMTAPYGGFDGFLKHLGSERQTYERKRTQLVRQGMTADAVLAELGEPPGGADSFNKSVNGYANQLAKLNLRTKR